jgi:hypothetical protein
MGYFCGNYMQLSSCIFKLIKMKSKRNTLAGKHPSYDKLGMTKAQKESKLEYDKKYQATEKRKNYRVELNKANRAAGTYGNKDGMDASHTKSGKIVMENKKSNRARNGHNGKSTKR